MLWQNESMVTLMLKHKYSILWIISGTVIMAYILGNYYYYLDFTYPDFIVKWSMNLYKPSNQEEVADLETILNFMFSFLMVSTVTFIFLIIKKKLKKAQAGAEKHAT